MQAVKCQQRDMERQTSFTEKGLKHLNSKVIALQFGEGADQEAAVSELTTLQESIHIIAHVAHAVAVKQLDMPQAHLQVPKFLNSGSSQASSERQGTGLATAALDPPLPEPLDVAMQNASRPNDEANAQILATPPLRGSFNAILEVQPAPPIGAQTIISGNLKSDEVFKVPDRGAASTSSAESIQPSPSTSLRGGHQTSLAGAANSMRALLPVSLQTNDVTRPGITGTSLEEASVARGSHPISRASVSESPEVLLTLAFLQSC